MAKNPGMPVDHEDPTGEDQMPDDAQGEQPNVSPEEQKQYDVVVTAAMKIMYDKGRLQTIVQKLDQGKDNLSQAIGHTAAMILMSVRSSVQKQGRTIPDDIVFAVGEDVVAQLCDIAVASKIIKQEQVEAIANAAMFEGVRAWGSAMAKNGDITPDVKRAAQEDMKTAGVKQSAQLPAQQAAPTEQPPQGGIVNAAAGA